MKTIDLNCDLGESWYDEIVSNDAAVMPLVTSCNLACGLHGGDPATLERAVELALNHGVTIGAHPSLPTRENFGRVAIDLSAGELTDLLSEQLERLAGVVAAADQRIRHLKPHGALYHLAQRRAKEAECLVEVAQTFGIRRIVGFPGGCLADATTSKGLDFIAEGFVDRAYANGTSLRNRCLPGAVLDHEAAIRQAELLALAGRVVDHSGRAHSLSVRTLCVHGDHPGAEDLIRKLRTKLADRLTFLPL